MSFIVAGKADNLIRQKADSSRQGEFFKDSISRIGFLTNNKKGLLVLNGGENIIIGEGPIPDHDIAGLETQTVCHVDFMGFPIGDIDQIGDVAGEIQKRVELDYPFLFYKFAH